MRRAIICFTSCLLLFACAQEEAPDSLSADAVPDIIAFNAFYYYDDVETAWAFYKDVLGLETVVDYGFAKILRIAESSYVTLVQADSGMHSTDEPRTVTLTLTTDTLTPWLEHFQAQGVATSHSEQNRFVVTDPGGYSLRFLRYNPHPNHADYNAAFSESSPVASSISANLNIRTTVYSAYFINAAEVEGFYSGLLDKKPSAQLSGDALYHIAGSGFLALVDGGDELHEATEENSVTFSFFTTDVDAWFERAGSWPGFELRTEEVLNEGGLVRVFVGYDPTGIFLEWDTFLSVDENVLLNQYLAQ